MPSPIILGYNTTESLCSINSIVIGIGGSLGTITAPLTPLNLSSENFAAAYGRSSHLATRTDHYSNEYLYDQWNLLPYSYQERFWDRNHRLIIQKRIYGAALGVQAGGAVSAAGNAVEQLIVSLAGRLIGRVISGIGLDSLQSSQSSVSTLYGINGTDTYNQNITDYSTVNTNIFIVQGSIGAIAQAGLNMVLFGNFPSIRTVGASMLLTPNSFTQSVAVFNYLRSVFARAQSVAFVGDAAIGVILPGVQLQVLAT